MLDSRRVNDLSLRLPDSELPDLVLSPGVHAIGRGDNGLPCIVDDPGDALAQLCIDRRGAWLQVHDGVRGVHVNGRPIRRMAMLIAGDAFYIDGVELLLLGDPPDPADTEASHTHHSDTRMVLRGVGGQHHGRCFSLDVPRRLGRGAGCDIRIAEASSADQQVVIEPHETGVLLRDLGAGAGCLINGHRAKSARLRPGDQVVFDAQHRFVVQSPKTAMPAGQFGLGDGGDTSSLTAAPRPAPVRPSLVRRMPWLLLAALMLSAALSALLLYGAP